MKRGPITAEENAAMRSYMGTQQPDVMVWSPALRDRYAALIGRPVEPAVKNGDNGATYGELTRRTW